MPPLVQIRHRRPAGGAPALGGLGVPHCATRTGGEAKVGQAAAGGEQPPALHRGFGRAARQPQHHRSGIGQQAGPRAVDLGVFVVSAGPQRARPQQRRRNHQPAGSRISDHGVMAGSAGWPARSGRARRRRGGRARGGPPAAGAFAGAQSGAAPCRVFSIQRLPLKTRGEVRGDSINNEND